jgi:hypothetical protein
MNHLFRQIFFLAIFLQAIICRAQEAIEAERPSESQTTQLVPKGKLQVEAGFEKSWENESGYTLQIPELMLRYGLLKKLELRLSLINEKQVMPQENLERNGLLPLEIGLKVPVYAPDGSKFRVGLLGMAGLPILSSADHDPGHWTYGVRLLLDEAFTDKFTVNANAGNEWDSEDRQQVWLISMAPQLELNEHFRVFVEAIDYLKNHERHQPLLHTGLLFLPSKNLQLDLSAGKGLNESAPGYFVRTGVALRLSR